MDSFIYYHNQAYSLQWGVVCSQTYQLQNIHFEVAFLKH